jgi:lipopolysaccharide transport system ATP-binding protein
MCSSSSTHGHEVAINLVDVSKRFEIYEKPRHRLLQTLFRGRRDYYKEFIALSGISFDVYRGETVGIIGRNGAGKSTLLQLICGTMTQTSGDINVNGRIGALLELGAGFNPEFTGRENIYLSGAIQGIDRAEIASRYDEIVEFSGVGEFIDQPVKTYSSGMYVRLAFSVNIMSKPEIMIVDEALAVGDIRFQSKCMTALKRIQENGATVLFVSHDINSVKGLCSRCLYLESGRLKRVGKAGDIAELYLKDIREEMNADIVLLDRSNLKSDEEGHEVIQNEESAIFKSGNDFDKTANAFRYGTGEAKISYVELLDEDNNIIESVNFNQKVKVRIYVEAYNDAIISVNYNVLDDKKINILGCNFVLADKPLLEIKKGDKYIIEYSFRLPVQNGNYSIRARITSPAIDKVSAKYIDSIEDAVVFTVNIWEKARVWSKVFSFPSLDVIKVS